MDINTIVVEPCDEKNTTLYDTVVHVPFSLATDCLSDLLIMLAGIEGVDMVKSFPVGDHALHVHISPVMDNVDEIFGCVLMLLISGMETAGMDDLQVKVPGSVSRKFERRLAGILRQLAKEEWDEAHDEQVQVNQTQLDTLVRELEGAEAQVLWLGQNLEEIARQLTSERRELSNAQKALRSAVNAKVYDEGRVIRAALRIDTAKLALGKGTLKFDQLTDESDELSGQIVSGVGTARQLDIELDELKAQKRPKFGIVSKLRRGFVVLTVVAD